MKKPFFLIFLACILLTLTIQANNGHNKLVFQKEKFSCSVNIKDSIPKDTTNTKPAFNPGNINPSTFVGDPFIRNPNSNNGGFASDTKIGKITGNFIYEGSNTPTIQFDGPKQTDKQNGFYLGYSLSENTSTDQKIGAYVRRQDGVILVFGPNMEITTATSVPKGLYNGSNFYKSHYLNQSLATKSSPNSNLNPNFNNAPSGKVLTPLVLGTATISQDDNNELFLRPSNSSQDTSFSVGKVTVPGYGEAYISLFATPGKSAMKTYKFFQVSRIDEKTVKIINMTELPYATAKIVADQSNIQLLN